VTLKPLGDRIVIRRAEEEEQVKGGIIIPDSAKEKPQRGEVVAAGPGKRADDGKVIALDVKVGDVVLFGKYSGSDVTVDGEDVFILREDEILAVVE
jgi:chaperonin GroES